MRAPIEQQRHPRERAVCPCLICRKGPLGKGLRDFDWTGQSFVPDLFRGRGVNRAACTTRFS